MDNNAINEEQKKQVLKHIKQIDVTELIEKYIKPNQITFQEMKETGQLDHVKQSKIREYLEEQDRKQKEIDTAWEICQRNDTIAGYMDFKNAYPNSPYETMADTAIGRLQEGVEAATRALIERIRSNSNYMENDLKTDLESGRISRERLVNENVITDHAIDLIFNPPTFFVDQNTWKDLDPLPEGPTDIYFFGIPGSGKSCVLSGVLSRASSRGILKENTDYFKGVRYMNNLKRCSDIGYAPPPTAAAEDTVNFIQCAIKDKKSDRMHELSFVEMSGEYFKNSYSDNDINSTRSIGAKGYLKNDNKKLIFLVIDYLSHGSESVHVDTTQEDLLFFVLDRLAKDGTLKKTDSIQIIVTKSDKIPHEDKLTYAKDFLKENYPRLINLIIDLNKQFQINKHRNYEVIYHPFSYGRFMVGRTFEFNPADSDKLLLTILNSTQPTKKGGVFTRYMNKNR